MLLRFLAVAVLGFAIVARTTRFLNDDTLFEPARDRLESWARDGRVWRAKIAYLVTCPWCASIWIALPVALYGDLVLLDLPWQWDLWVVLGLWLGWSYAYGRLATWLED